MNNILKNKNKKWIIYYGLYILGIIIMHFFMEMDFGDDSVSKQLTEGYNVFQWVVFRYNNWSARFIQEGLGFYMIWHPMLWRVINIIIMGTIPLICAYLIDAEDNDKYFCVFIFMLYPIIDMKSAGWICTTNTYLWPAYFGLLVGVILKKYSVSSQKFHWYECILFYILLIISCNHELLAVLLLCVMLFYVAYCLLDRKKIPYMVFGGILIDIMNIIFILLSPGNALRKQAEAANRWIEFNDFSIIDKIYLGILHTFKVLVVEMNPVFLFLCIMLCIVSFLYIKENVYKMVGMIPVASILLINTILTPYTVEDISSVNYYKIGTYIPIVISGIILVSITFTIVAIIKDTEEKGKWYLFLVLLYAGLATQVAMGFSPTIYASGNRTATFMYFSMIYCSLIMYQYIKERSLTSFERQQVSGYTFSVLGTLTYLANLVVIVYYV